MELSCPYGFGKMVTLPFAETVQRVRAALAEEGFGILTEIDVPAKLREKLGIEFRPYLILGACNPRLGHRALQIEINLGLLLPCNVVVYAEGEGRTAVLAMDPVAAMSVVDNPAMAEIAGQVRELLAKVVDRI